MEDNKNSFPVDIKDLEIINIFQNIELKQLESQLDQIRKLTLPGGETLLSPSSMNEEIFILLKGELMICLQDNDHHAIARILPGDCVGELSIIDDRAPSAYVKTSGQCTLLAIHRDVLTTMFEQQPDLAVNLLKLLTERFRQNNTILSNSFKLQREYRNKAERDAPTGLHNRAWMNDVFPKQLELSERIGQKVTLMMIDADYFKKVNDNHGHVAGDETLKHLCKVISENLRETDLLVRFGGEELVVLMPGTIVTQAHVVAERVRSLVESQPVILDNGKNVDVTISIGLAEWSEEESVENLIEKADRALYSAKESGRNKVGIF